MKKNKNAQGLTLVEIVISITVLAIAVLGTVSSVVASANLARTAAETRRATRTSAALMDAVRATAFDQLETTFNETTHAFHDIVDTEDQGTVRVAVERIDNGSEKWLVYRVTMTATWSSLTGEQTSDFVTYVADRAAASTHVNSGYVPPEPIVTAPESL